MEKTMSVEEKIRRAEEIYARRQGGNSRSTTTVTVNNQNRKDIKLIKKMIIQMVVSLVIYLVIYMIQNNNYVFSEDFIKKADEILSYDINFEELYENVKTGIETNINKMNQDNNEQQMGIGGTEENVIEDTNVEENAVNEINSEIELQDEKNNNEVVEENTSEAEPQQELTQEEQDIADIKATTTFIKPVEGEITSKFGQREAIKSNMTTNHTGTDIGANMGTKILSSTDGEVVLVSDEGDLGKHVKIQIGEVSVVYAHCNKIYVNQGDKVTQGQEIAEVGSTGNSTGPHLHFEIRIHERLVDPEKILEL